MGIENKISDKAEDLKGRAKEAAGAATNDDELRAEGKADQGEAGLKGKIDDATDKAKDVADSAADKARGIVS